MPQGNAHWAWLLAFGLTACTVQTGGLAGPGPRATGSAPRPTGAASQAPSAQASPASGQPPVAQAPKLFLPLRLSPVLPASLVGNDGAALLANDGGGLIANDGAALLANDGGGLIANDGVGLLANDGGGLIANDGAGVVAAGAGNFRLAQAEGAASAAGFDAHGYLHSQSWRQSNMLYLMDQLLWAWGKGKPQSGRWLRFSLPLKLLPKPGNPSDPQYGAVNGMMATALQGKTFHFASHFAASPDRLVLRTVALPRADAPLSEGYPVFWAQSTQPGALEVVANQLSRMLPLLRELLLEDLALKAKVRWQADGQRSLDFTLASSYGSVKPGSLASLLPNAALTRDSLGLERVRYQWDGQGHYRMQFGEARRQQLAGLPDRIRYLVSVRTGEAGLAGWIRGQELEPGLAEAPWFYISGQNNQRVYQDQALGIYGDAAGQSVPQATPTLGAMLPDASLTQDPSWLLPMPAAGQKPTDGADFQPPAIPAELLLEAEATP